MDRRRKTSILRFIILFLYLKDSSSDLQDFSIAGVWFPWAIWSYNGERMIFEAIRAK